MCVEPKEHKHIRPGTRPEGSVTGVTEKVREVPNGVGADGVGVKFPIFPVNCSRLPLFQENRQKTKKHEEKRRKTKKNEEKRKKTKKRRKTKKNEESGKIPPTPSTPTPLRTFQ